MISANSFGAKLRALRSIRDMTQDELGKALDIPGNTLGGYERDKREPSIPTINSIAQYFNIRVDLLINDKITVETVVLASINPDKAQLDVVKALQNDPAETK